MEKNAKIVLGLAVIIVVAVLVYYFLLAQPVSFDQEYLQMQGAWKGNGITDERLHASPAVFSLSKADIGKIKADIVSFKKTAKNQATAELADIYILLLEDADAALQVKEASGLQTPSCQNLGALSALEAELKSAESKKAAYLDAVNSFVIKYPEEAESISLFAVEKDYAGETAGPLLAAISAMKEVC
ncbi:MAG: hypothetical protein V1493_06775 [Candidatus Diapherotrites archaeon]